MTLTPALRLLCLLNATVLLTHQIDAAYWHEWEMFRIPGGNQMNLLLNLPIVALLLHAYAQVAAGTVHASRYALLLAALGGLTAVIHAAFFLAGDEAFHQPASIALLAATALLSLALVFLLRTHGRTSLRQTPAPRHRS